MKQWMKLVGAWCLLICVMLASGCGLPGEGQDKGLDAGLYKRVYLLPQGRFVGIEKIKDAAHKGLAYKVEMDEQKRVKEVTAVYNDKPIDVRWGLDIVGTSIRFARVKIKYEDNGSMIYSFQSESGRSVNWQGEAAAIRFTDMNEQGLPGKAEYLNEELHPVNGKGRNLAAEFTYADHNMLETMKLSGWLKSGEDLQIKFYYDQNFLMHKLPVGMEITDTDGKLRPGFGDIARIVWQYDKQNRLIKEQFFGVDGEAVNGNMSAGTMVYTPHSNGYERFCSSFACEYDDNQFSPKKITFYNADGELWKSKSDGSVVPQPVYHFTYDESGNLIKVEAKDAEGSAAEFYPGIYAIGYGYDDVGNLNECSFYDDEGQLALTNWKFAKWRRVYDTHRQVIEISYFGTDDEKVNAAIKENGKDHYYHKRVMERDSDGRISQNLYYNANGKQTK